MYALLNPTNQCVFYVGKGQGGRVAEHFGDARNFSSVKIAERKKHKLETIDDLLRLGKKPSEMTKILARIETDDDSLLLETFFMKFCFNPRQLENATSGKYHELFRANNDWQIRHGFEIRTETKGSGNRKIQEDLFKGQFLNFLDEIASEIVKDAKSTLNIDLVFDDARISGAGELSRDAVLSTPVGHVLLRLHIRSEVVGQI
ncbi:MAG: LEM-3-like GIY-YIG domain-containing protein [Fluviibacter sp.]